MSERTYRAAELAALLDGGLPPGLVRLAAPQPAAEVQAAAARAGWHTDRLDLYQAADKPAFMARCARDLSLPDWFGRNWDALYDCLSDPDWIGPQRRLVLACGWQDYATAQPEQWAVAEGVFAAAAEDWRQTATPLLVVLLEDEPVTTPERPTPGTSGPGRSPTAGHPRSSP